jgi:hypothetical protein
MNRLQGFVATLVFSLGATSIVSGCGDDAKNTGSGGRGGTAGNTTAGSGGKMGTGGSRSGGTGGQGTGGSGPDPCLMLDPAPGEACQGSVFCPIAGADCICMNRRWVCYEVGSGGTGGSSGSGEGGENAQGGAGNGGTGGSSGQGGTGGGGNAGEGGSPEGGGAGV